MFKYEAQKCVQLQNVVACQAQNKYLGRAVCVDNQIEEVARSKFALVFTSVNCKETFPPHANVPHFLGDQKLSLYHQLEHHSTNHQT